MGKHRQLTYLHNGRVLGRSQSALAGDQVADLIIIANHCIIGRVSSKEDNSRLSALDVDLSDDSANRKDII
jgi:hypothetical protein